MAHALSLIGAAMPLDPIPAGPDNTEGFWEPRSVVQLNEALLSRQGARWDDPIGLGAIKPMTNDPERLGEARDALRDSFPDTDLIALKDPRLSILAPLWIRAAALEGRSTAAIVMVRSPQAVSASLAARNGMADVRAQLLWARYMLEAERHTRETPRLFVDFDDLIDRPRATLARIGARFGLAGGGRTTSAKAKAIVRPELRRHDYSGAGAGAVLPQVGAVADALRAATRDRRLRPSALQDCSAWLTDLERVLTPMLADEREQNAFLRSEIRQHKAFEAHLNLGVEALRAEIGRLTALSLAQQAEIVRLTPRADPGPDTEAAGG